MQNVFIAMGFAFIPVTLTLLVLLVSARTHAQKAEAIAVEVERISEAQRFTTKLLSERLSSRLPAEAPRSITPH